jgi:hypothetical protein
METVYIAGIIAAVVAILGVVWLLRDRIIGGRIGASAEEKKVEAEFEAVPPPERPGESRPGKPPSVDISGNWLVGANVIRVLRDSVRVARNRLLGRSRIEVETESPQAAKPPQKKTKKRKK